MTLTIKPVFITSLVLGAITCLPALAQEEQAPVPIRVEVVSLEISRTVKTDADENEDKRFRHRQRQIGHSKGTELELAIIGGDLNLVGIDYEASVLELFVDDTGKTLFNPKSDDGFNRWRLVDGMNAATLEIEAGEVPHARARSILLSGSLVLTVAEEQADVKHEAAAMVKGTNIQAGPINCTISETGAPEWKPEAFEVELKFDREIPEIVEIKFLDAEGDLIKSDQTSSGTSRSNGKVTAVRRGFTLDKKVERATVVFTIWSELKPVTYPVLLNFGLGLEEGAGGGGIGVN